jgi:hypothetical protein
MRMIDKKAVELVRTEIAKQGRSTNVALLLRNEGLIERRADVVVDFETERKSSVEDYANIDYTSYYPDLYAKRVSQQ